MVINAHTSAALVVIISPLGCSCRNGLVTDQSCQLAIFGCCRSCQNLSEVVLPQLGETFQLQEARSGTNVVAAVLRRSGAYRPADMLSVCQRLSTLPSSRPQQHSLLKTGLPAQRVLEGHPARRLIDARCHAYNECLDCVTHQLAAPLPNWQYAIAQIVAPTNAASQNVVQNANSFDLSSLLKESPEKLVIALTLTAAAAVGYWLSQKSSEQ